MKKLFAIFITLLLSQLGPIILGQDLKNNLLLLKENKQIIPKGLSLPSAKVFSNIDKLTGRIIFSENFESGAGGWTIQGGIWQIGKPTSEPNTANSGSGCAGTNLSGNYPNNSNARLISPSIALPSLSYTSDKIRLAFFQWYQTESKYDFCNIQISTDNGSSWIQLKYSDGSPVQWSGSSTSWYQSSFDLTNYAGKTVKLGFLFTSDASTNYAGWYIDDVSLEYVENVHTSNLEIAVASNGQYTMGIPNGSVLLFGHPNPWSSATTLRIDGSDYWNFNGSSIGTVISPSTTQGLSNSMSWNIGGKIKLIQTLTIVKGSSNVDYNTAEIRLTTVNLDNTAHSVGIRLLFDTMLGNNDGAPFRVPGVGAVTTDYEWYSTNMPAYYQAFDDLTNPKNQSQGTLIGGNAKKPDHFITSSWPNIVGTMWDYSIVPGRNYSSTSGYFDSGILIFWNPVILNPGESKDFVTYYGLGAIDVDVQPPLVVGLTAPNSVVFLNGESASNPFTLTAYLENSSPGVSKTATGVLTTLHLPSGLEFPQGENSIHSIPNLSINSSYQTSYSIKVNPTTNGKQKYSLDVAAANITSKTLSKDIYVFGIETSPKNNEQVLSSINSISAKFNVNMDVSTISNGTILLSDETKGTCFANLNINYNSTNRTVTITTSGILESGHTYKIIFKSSIKSDDGTSLPYDLEWIFNTEAISQISFRPDKDGFYYYNRDYIMWPEAVWPFKTPIFPSWELFVEAFGDKDIYFLDGSTQTCKRYTAKQKYEAIKDSINGKWIGSCFGFSLASLLFFDNYLPKSINVHDMRGDNICNLINKYQLYQYSGQCQEYFSKVKAFTPLETIAEIKKSFFSNNQHNIPITICNTKKKGGHALVPYKITKNFDEAMNINWSKIYVYDCNYPSDTTLFIRINESKNEWEYIKEGGIDSGWGGYYYFRPAIDVSTFSNNEKPTLLSAQMTEIYFNKSSQIAIKNNYGESITNTFFDVFNTSGVIPVIPLQGGISDIIGFYFPNLAAEDLVIQMSSIDSLNNYITIFSDKSAINANLNVHELGVTYKYSFNKKEGRFSSKINSNSSYFNIVSIKSNSSYENVIKYETNSIVKNDSLDFINSGEGNNFTLKNYGSNKNYKLSLTRNSANPDSIKFDEIALGKNEAHIIKVKDWSNVSKSEITLSVDKGMDGSIDYVINLNTPKTGGALEKSNIYFYPNPFNPPTQTGVFRYSLSKDGNIKIKIFDAANVLVKEIPVGYQHGKIEQSIPWDGKNDNGIIVANGVYLYFVESDSGERAVGKIAVIK